MISTRVSAVGPVLTPVLGGDARAMLPADTPRAIRARCTARWRGSASMRLSPWATPDATATWVAPVAQTASAARATAACASAVSSVLPLGKNYDEGGRQVGRGLAADQQQGGK